MTIFTRSPRRRAADATAARLGHIVLAYLGVVVAIITLAPFEFVAHVAHGVSMAWTGADLVLNVVMFVPIGFVYMLTRPHGDPHSAWRVLLLGVVASGGIEVAQLFAPGRFTSPFDLATNTAGALIGAWAQRRLARRVEQESAMTSLALDLPLMAIVYLLLPLCWLIGLASDDELRRLLVLLPGAMVGIILGTVHAAYATATPPRWWLVAFPVSWSLVAFAPAARGDLTVVVPGAVFVLAVAVLRDQIGRRITREAGEGHVDGGRRFELPTLRLVLPLYAAYLALAAVWPLGQLSVSWRATMTLMLPGAVITNGAIFRVLEQVTAFTLVGYLGAEYHGRATHRGWPAVMRVLAWSSVVSLLLQIARGFVADAGASGALFVLTQLAAAFGVLLYQRQREHIRALISRRGGSRRHPLRSPPDILRR